MTENSEAMSGDAEMAEINAIGQVYGALKGLKREEQRRVVEYVMKKLGLEALAWSSSGTVSAPESTFHASESSDAFVESDEAAGGALDGVSGIAQKWMKRSSLTESSLSPIFSLQLDEIDLIAGSIPGKSGKDRLRSVLLLRGIAGYLSNGAARFTHEQLRETASHYKAWDGPNFSAYMKSFLGEVTGTKEGGYTLTPRGLAEATKLIKTMVSKGD